MAMASEPGSAAAGVEVAIGRDLGGMAGAVFGAAGVDGGPKTAGGGFSLCLIDASGGLAVFPEFESRRHLRCLWLDVVVDPRVCRSFLSPPRVPALRFRSEKDGVLEGGVDEERLLVYEYVGDVGRGGRTFVVEGGEKGGGAT
nr:hypothetical protein CFP56_03747 [Quercus suber]